MGFTEQRLWCLGLLNSVNEHFTLSFSNQYHTAAHLTQDQPLLDLDPLIDPCAFYQSSKKNLGFIWRITRCCTTSRSQKMGKLISSIQLCPTYIDDTRSDTTQYKTIDPGVFRHGQMVQVQFSVLTVPITRSRPGQSSYYMATNLAVNMHNR